MIRDIWLRIAALLALAVFPIMFLQLKLQQDSVALVYSLADKTEIRPTLDESLKQLRESARALPEKEAEYKAAFQKTLETKRSLEEFFLAQSSIDRDIRTQTVIITLLVLAISLLGSVWISRGIVRRVQTLINERERAASKLRDLKSLQNWQGVAKILVHELRAPLTPIKLVTTDLDHQYRSMSGEAFGAYLKDAQKLMNEQIEAIETMISGFTAFGKLPIADLKLNSMNQLIRDFLENYARSFGEGVSIRFEPPEGEVMASLDAKLLRDLFYNIAKNAVEANAGKTDIDFHLSQDENILILTIRNSGVPIPPSVAETLFDPYVSTKSAANMGLGLAISRKIAFDHQGDLRLIPSASGAVFQLEIPLKQSAVL